MQEKEKSEKKDAEENKKESEPDTEVLDNPSRVMQVQVELFFWKFVAFLYSILTCRVSRLHNN